MKQKFLLKVMLLLCALIVGSSSVWASNNVSTVSTTFSATGDVTDKFTQTGDFTKAEWNLAVTWKNSASWQALNADKGSQIGSGSKPATGIVLTGSSIPGTITSVVVNTSGASSVNATVAVTVGGTAFKCNKNTTANLTSSAANYEFTGSASGDVVVTWANSSDKALYIKSITTTYSTGSSSDPSISASNVNIAQDATNGSIEYSLSNATGNVSASITSGDWLTLGTITASAVPFTCSANTGAERTATVTLSFTGASNKVVTITQAAKTVEKPTFNLDGGSYMQGTNITISSEGNSIYYNLTTDGSTPATPTNASTEYTAPIVLGSGTTKITAIAYDTYGNASGTTTRTYTGIAFASLPFSWTGTKTAAKDELAAETGIALSLGSNYADSNAPYRLKFDGVGKNVTIYTDGKPENVYFTAKLLSGKADTGSKIKVQGSDDGITFTDIEEFTIKGAANATFEFTTSNAFAATHRAVKLVMSSKDVNVGVGTICVSCIPLTPAKTYTTLTHAKNLDFTNVTGLKAYIATTISDSKVQMMQVNKVPANTGLVLKATTPGSAVNVPVFDGTGADDVIGNLMKGSATTTTTVAENAGYILKDGVFQPSSGVNALPAGKAYLNIAVSSAPFLSLDFGNEATNIADVRSKMENVKGEVYNLNGQRVAQPTKGLYIVNGKKVVLH